MLVASLHMRPGELEGGFLPGAAPDRNNEGIGPGPCPVLGAEIPALKVLLEQARQTGEPGIAVGGSGE